MRFYSEYKDYKTKEERNVNTRLLDTFLDEYAIDVDCGDTFEGIDILFLNHAPEKRVEKEKKLYDVYARVEVKSEFQNPGIIDVREFQDAFYKIFEAMKRVENIQMEQMDFQLKPLMEVLQKAEQNLFSKDAELIEYSKRQEEIKRNNRLRQVNLFIKKDRERKRELTKKIRGIGIVVTLKDPEVRLEPYAYRYENIFTNLLVREGILLPGYSEIFVEINKTLDEAKKEAGFPEDWGKCTFAEIDVEKYANATEEEKSRMVFESVCQGLRFIAEFDHLDSEAIERVIDIVRREGAEIELVHKEKENEQYSAKIVYHVTDVASEDALFQLRFKEKMTGKEVVVDLGYADLWFGPQISGIRLTKKEVVIEGRKSVSAELSRNCNSLKESYRFNIEELL